MTWKILLLLILSMIVLSAPVLGCWMEKPEDWDDELDGVFEPCQENEEVFDSVPYVEIATIQNNFTEAGQALNRLEALTEKLGEQMKELQNEVSILNNEITFLDDVIATRDFIMSVMFRDFNETQYEELFQQIQKMPLSSPRRLPWENHNEEGRKKFVQMIETLISQHQNKE